MAPALAAVGRAAAHRRIVHPGPPKVGAVFVHRAVEVGVVRAKLVEVPVLDHPPRVVRAAQLWQRRRGLQAAAADALRERQREAALREAEARAPQVALGVVRLLRAERAHGGVAGRHLGNSFLETAGAAWRCLHAATQHRQTDGHPLCQFTPRVQFPPPVPRAAAVPPPRFVPSESHSAVSRSRYAPVD